MPSGLFWQNLLLRPDIPVSMGLITAKSLSTPRYPGIDRAYYGKIPFCAPISRYRRGLLRQNPYLRPDIPVSMGLITAKFLSAPRYPGIDGAYYGKNPYLCPDVLPAMGLITAKFLSAPRYPGIDRAYYGKILICTPMYKGGGYNRPGLVSHTRVCEGRWV